MGRFVGRSWFRRFLRNNLRANGLKANDGAQASHARLKLLTTIAGLGVCVALLLGQGPARATTVYGQAVDNLLSPDIAVGLPLVSRSIGDAIKFYIPLGR